jgi:hypothetical protein
MIAYQAARYKEGGVEEGSSLSHWVGQILLTSLSLTQPRLHLVTLEASSSTSAPTYFSILC